MTVATRTFQSIQPKTPLEDQKSRVPINQALQYLSGTLQDDIDTEIAAQLAAFITVPHTWTAAQTIAPPSGAAVLTLKSAAGSGPSLDLINTAAGSAGSEIPQINFYGNDDAGNQTLYGFIDSIIKTATNGAEAGRVRIVTLAAGAAAARITIESGVIIGNATGGDQGAGTLNMDNAIFRDGLQVVGPRVTGWAAATNTKSKATFDTTTVTLPELAARVGQIIDDLIAHGLQGA